MRQQILANARYISAVKMKAVAEVSSNAQAAAMSKVKNLLSGNGIDGNSFKRSDNAKLGLNVLLSWLCFKC
jgi:23S rRNA maturation mini-RNase III